MYIQIVLLVVLATAQGQLTSNGSCNFADLQIEMEIPTESWPEKMYENSRINNNWQSGQCALWSLKQNNDSSALMFDVQMTEVVNRKLVERNATTAFGLVGNTTVIAIDFNDFSSNFTILGLSSEFLLLYACSNQGGNRLEYVWRLSPNTSLSATAINKSEEILSNNNLVNLTWNSVSHSEESCKTGGAASLKISSFIVLLVGFALLKGF